MVTLVRSLLIVTLLMIHGSAYSAPVIEASISSAEIEYGQSTILTLISENSDISLQTIDLGGLQESFFVTELTQVIDTDDGQKWRLRLYPRRTGVLLIPGIVYAGISTPAHTITVKPAMHKKRDEALMLQLEMPTDQSWVNQQRLITVSLMSSDHHLLLKTEGYEHEAGELHALSPLKSLDVTTGMMRYTVGWAYFPLQSGKHMLDLPPVQLHTEGSRSHRFYLPQQLLDVTSLPFYVPSNLPVGEFSLTVAPQPLFYLTNRLDYLDLDFYTHGILPGQQPAIENFIAGDKELRLYPASRDMTYTSDMRGLRSHATLKVPFKADSIGYYLLDDIEMHYFNPRNGKLEMMNYHWPPLVFISPWLLAIALLLLAIIFIPLLKMLFDLLNSQRVTWIRMREARQLFVAASSARELRSALLELIAARHGDEAVSLHQWHSESGIDFNPLSQALYRTAAGDIGTLKEFYAEYFRYRWPFAFTEIR